MAKFSKKFGMSATLTYDGPEELIASPNLSDYFELLTAAKFTICPPGMLLFVYKIVCLLYVACRYWF